MTSDRRLQLEANAVSQLREMLKEVTDDEIAVADTIEGETDLKGAVHAVYRDLLDDEMLVSGIDDTVDILSARRERLSTRIERRRKAICRAMEVAEVKSIPLPEATLSLRAVAPGLDVKDESQIPDIFFNPQPPKLDRKALKEALSGGAHVLGATLTNGGIGITIRKS